MGLERQIVNWIRRQGGADCPILCAMFGAGWPRSRGGRDLGDIRGCTDLWNEQKLKLLDLMALPK